MCSFNSVPSTAGAYRQSGGVVLRVFHPASRVGGGVFKNNMKGKCCYCGKEYTVKNSGSFNRSIRLGLPVFCGRECFGLSRRTNETEEEKKQFKQWYDLFIRASMTDDQKDFKAFSSMVYFHIDYRDNPEKYKAIRQQRMPRHVEYCRQPEYKEYKKKYDEVYNAKVHYGDFWEAAIVLKNLEKEIDARGARRENKLYNKSTTKRKRLWQKMLKTNLRRLT